MNWLLEICVLCTFLHGCKTSIGDTSNEYRSCFHVCHFNNCTGYASVTFKQKQSLSNRFLLWSCEDECKYDCMWHATEVFMDRGREVPQFFGKWPFIKLLGIQEPASVIFSFLNFHAYLHTLIGFRQSVPPTAPMFYVWHMYSLVCLNGWLWSMVFHARDTHFTEKMDYFCAFSMVTFSFLAFCLRAMVSFQTRLKQYVTLVIGAFFCYHIWYLSGRSFDYGYNMKVNVLVGLLNGMGWLLWSWSRGAHMPHLVWCRITVAGLAVSMLLELLDFAPFFWVFDAHALWHLSTFPLPFYWYRFVIGDCLHLLNSQALEEKSKKLV